MDETPNRTRPSERAAPSYPYIQEAFPNQFIPNSVWMNTQNNSQACYGGPYFPYVAQPPNISTSPTLQTRTENYTLSVITILSKHNFFFSVTATCLLNILALA
jgi:hypothetical protein